MPAGSPRPPVQSTGGAAQVARGARSRPGWSGEVGDPWRAGPWAGESGLAERPSTDIGGASTLENSPLME